LSGGGRTDQDLPFDGRMQQSLEEALREDVGLGDVTGDSTLDEALRTGGEFLVKAEGVLAGTEIAWAVFRLSDEEVLYTPVVPDGSRIAPGTVIALVEGNARGILRTERVALNFLQRMSGIATLTRRYVDAVAGTRAKITDTRKTAPGLRAFDKLAVRIGGGVNHRFGLDDMVLIKDNHIAAAGGITAAVRRCRDYLRARRLTVPIEVETTTLDEVREALALEGIQRIMLDNMPLPEMREAVELIHGRTEVEASGGITLATVGEVAACGVDFISIGALTHSVPALDISLELTSGYHVPHA
jgi:nicotinate-nucleotide pyrophosphorylase (carboxylating)